MPDLTLSTLECRRIRWALGRLMRLNFEIFESTSTKLAPEHRKRLAQHLAYAEPVYAFLDDLESYGLNADIARPTLDTSDCEETNAQV